MSFPSLDPIPLPAPVWIFKLLHVVTLVLHFAAVHLMVGGLTLATIWNLRARRDPNSAAGRAAAALAHRLPVIMTYLINLGIPPLLFAQVLYGRALYTSSVLIGAYWIAVIFLLMGAYYLLYVANRREEAGRSWWWISLVSLILIAYIGRIYSSNMTLMIRPEVWMEMYRARGGAQGTSLPSGDPTILPRWLFMMVGSIGFGGILAALVGTVATLPEAASRMMRRSGGLLGGFFLAVQLGLGWWVWQVQPELVRGRLLESSYRFAPPAWLIVTLLALLSAVAIAFTSVSRRRFWPFLAGLFGLLSIAAAVVVRDGIRDLTLLVKGFDVWAQPVVSNWSVVILFLVLFVAGLLIIGWMARVAAQAKGVVEENV